MTLQHKNNPTEKKGLIAIIRYMIRTYKKWKLIKELNEDCLGWIRVQNTDDLVNGLWLGLNRPDFVITHRNKIANKFSWFHKMNLPIGSRELNVKIENYQKLITACIEDGYIEQRQLPNDPRVLIKLSTQGDEFLSRFAFIQKLAEKFPATWILIGWVITTLIATTALYFSIIAAKK